MTSPRTTDQNAKLAARIIELERAVRDVANRPFTIPVLPEDPPESSPVNLWFLPDGRLRGRHLDPTGASLVYREWVATAPGSGTSADAPAPPATAPATYQNSYGSTWWASYRENGALRTGIGTSVYQGRSDGSNGRQRSLIGFDAAAIAADLAGATINNAWLDLTNRHAWWNDGVDYSIRLHDFGSAPGTWTGGLPEYARRHWPKVGYARQGLGPGIGQALRGGTASGVALEAPSNSYDFYGYADGASAVLIINYTR